MQSQTINVKGKNHTITNGNGYIIIYKTTSEVLTDIAGIVTHMDEFCITLEHRKKVHIESIESIIEI
ncbi:MAG: hypothetical protein RR846_00880 [Oscillospiraceae bacterium]